MKKYIVILLSFGLFSLPLGVFAQVDVSACTSATTEDICNAGCEWGRDNTTCTICPQTTYSTDGIYGCKDCIKPTNAEFILASGYEYAGMTGAQECPWTVSVCDENMYIKDLKWNEWNANTELTKDLCVKCDDGHYADNTKQTWENYSLSNPCKPNRFHIIPQLKIQRPDGIITVTPTNSVGDPLSFSYDYKSGNDIETITKFQDRILLFLENSDSFTATELQNKYNFPPEGTEFVLKPTSEGGPDIDVRYYATKLSFTDYNDSMSRLGVYKNGATFDMAITMVPKKYNICYCSARPDSAHVSSLSSRCYCQNNVEFGTMQKASRMTNEMNTIIGYDCNGQYLSQWYGHLYIVSTSGYMSHIRTFDNLIDIGAQISEPESSSQYIILTPYYVSCLAGTYNSNSICPTECTQCSAGTYSNAGAQMCTQCPAGTASGIGASECVNCPAGQFSSAGSAECSSCPTGFTTPDAATSRDQCYIPTSVKFKDNNAGASFNLRSNVYLY